MLEITKDGWGGGGGGETVDGVIGAGMTDIPPCPNSAEEAGTGSANIIRSPIIQKTALVIRFRLLETISDRDQSPPD